MQWHSFLFQADMTWVIVYILTIEALFHWLSAKGTSNYCFFKKEVKHLQIRKYSKQRNTQNQRIWKANPTCLNPSVRPARPTLPPSPQKPEGGCFWYQILNSISISKNNRGDLVHKVGSFDARHYINTLTNLQCLPPVLFRHNHHRQPTPLCFVIKSLVFFLSFLFF